MTEYQLTFGVVYPRAVGGDHKRVNSQCITDLRHIHMMAAGGKNKMHAFIDGQQAEGFLGVGVKLWAGDNNVPSKSEATT